MRKAVKIQIKTLPVIFNVLLFVLISSIVFPDQSIKQVKLSTHSFEGNMEQIAFSFTEPVNENLYLEVYEFHYIMFPELAPEEDTWYHEKQMSFMKDVLAGEANAYNPNLSDKKVKEILNVSPKETIKLSSIDNKTFYTDWKAHHGRIFFRIKTDKVYFDDNIYTMRVHCRYIDMRTFENLKEQLQSIKLPLGHKNSFFAKNLYEKLYASYTQGHSPRFMLIHHEKQTGDLDSLFKQLESSIDRSAFYEAKKIIVQIEEKIKVKEELFYKISPVKNNNVVNINVEDNINSYSFYEDPNVEVYVKEYREPSMDELVAKDHSFIIDHSKMDPSVHQKMLKPEKTQLTKGAFKLEKSNNLFTGTLPETWGAISVVVFYGMDQNYYLTYQFKLN